MLWRHQTHPLQLPDITDEPWGFLFGAFLEKFVRVDNEKTIVIYTEYHPWMCWRFRVVLMHRSRDKMATFRRRYFTIAFFQWLLWHFEFISQSPIDNTSTLIQSIAWFPTGDEPPPGIMMTLSLRPQHVNLFGHHEKFQEDSEGFIWIKWDRIKRNGK